MRKSSIGVCLALAGLALVSVRPAFADDNATSSLNAKPAVASPTPAAQPAPAPSSSSFTWSGVYIGASVGYNWAKGDTTFGPLPTPAQFINLEPQTLPLSPRGIIGGLQMGYDHQHRKMVLGVVGDFSGTNSRASVVVSPIIQNNGTPFGVGSFESARVDTKTISTIRGRIGYAWGSRFLVYATGGLAFGRVFQGADTDFQPGGGTTDYLAKLDHIKMGIAAGGGGEFSMTHHWSAGAEFIYVDLGNETNITNPTPALPPFQVAYTWQTKSKIARGFINYRF
jgi:outer membrane immunogenic protein